MTDISGCGPNEDVSVTLCKANEMSQLSGIKRRILCRYRRTGLLRSKDQMGLGFSLYTRQDLILLERLTVMQTMGLSHNEIKDCMDCIERGLSEELKLQREIFLEIRRRLNRTIYFLEYAELVNRDPQSQDWHYLGKVVESIQSLRDTESFKRSYLQGRRTEAAKLGS